MKHRRRKRWWRTQLMLVPAMLMLAGTEVRCAPATPPGSDPTTRVRVSRAADDDAQRQERRRSGAHTETPATGSAERAALLVLLGVGAGTRWRLP